MAEITEGRPGDVRLLQGNQAIARGALEAGIRVAAGYPGTPSSEIIENLAAASRERNLYVEWSANEKVAMEVAAAASFAELRSMCVMKQVGVNVAADFLLHLTQYGTRGGMVLVACEDPGALSSTNEGDSRHYARMMEFPLIEPGDFQEAKEMTRWAFELSEELRNLVMIRSVTRLSHASGNVVLGELPERKAAACFKYEGTLIGQMEGPVATLPLTLSHMHGRQQEKLKKAAQIFETSPFNRYSGPEQPELLVITSSSGYLYCKEAIHLLNVSDRVGLLKLGTTWPLPPGLLKRHLKAARQVFVVEELLSFLEDNVKVLAAELGGEIGPKTFFGKKDGTLPSVNELNPDRVLAGLSRILACRAESRPAEYERGIGEVVKNFLPARDIAFCPGCPHRASFWTLRNALALDARQGFVCGDIGCYSMGIGPTGYGTLKTLHAMGSGMGLASGFGQLGPFGMNQPILAVCGDSTFFHAVLPALVNAVHHRAAVLLVVLDNSGTGMTGFQSHPGLGVDAMGKPARAIDIARVCEAIGAEVTVCDPFELERTQRTLLSLLDRDRGVRVLVLRQICALSPEKKNAKMYHVAIDPSLCLGEGCGCNRMCTRVFRCPGLVWGEESRKARIDEVICAGCGVCAGICPSGAIQKKEVA